MHRFEVTGETTFHASHYLRCYRGSSETPHEHDYRLRVVLGVNGLDGDDISMDFLVLERILSEIKAHFDSGNINELVEFADKNPTAENLALVIGDMVNASIIEIKNARLTCIEIWELESMSVRVFYHE
jgi:6-pyruvoyltetrahydropterin/6-carboxytetrahydropterin synthase